MAPAKIIFSDHNATPPVFVAGSFTSWQPIEIEPVATEVEGQKQWIYEKLFDLAPGTYQYKFRLGPGDWWVCDLEAQRDRDASGNENNVIVVETQPEPAKPEVAPEPITEPESAVPEPVAAVITPQPETAPKANGHLVNGIHKSKVNDTPQPEEEIKTVVKSSEPTDVKPAVLTNGIHKQVTVSESSIPNSEPYTSEETKITESQQPVEEPKSAPTPTAEKVIESSPEAEKVVSKPANHNVDGANSLKAGTKESESLSTSVTSTKEKASGKKVEEPKKLSWFSRIFLCGSSRTTMLAAFVITVPLFAAYFIQK